MEAWMEWTFEGGLNSFGSRSRREPRPVINLACKGAVCQFEWHRDNKELLPSQALAWGGFFL